MKFQQAIKFVLQYVLERNKDRHVLLTSDIYSSKKNWVVFVVAAKKKY